MTKANPHDGLTLDEWIVDRIKDPELAVAYLREYLLQDADMSDAEYKELLACCLTNLGKAHGVTLCVSDV